MPDKPNKLEQRVGELAEKVDKLEQRLLIDGMFAARLAAMLCRENRLSQGELEKLFPDLKEQKITQTLAGQAAGFEIDRLLQEFRGAL
jgi:CRP-like cAMP-binding protein